VTKKCKIPAGTAAQQKSLLLPIDKDAEAEAIHCRARQRSWS